MGGGGGGGQGGGSPGKQGAGGVRETGEERAGGGISTMAGSGREICTRVSTVSVVSCSVSSVLLAVEILCKNDKASQVNVVRDHLDRS